MAECHPVSTPMEVGTKLVDELEIDNLEKDGEGSLEMAISRAYWRPHVSGGSNKARHSQHCHKISTVLQFSKENTLASRKKDSSVFAWNVENWVDLLMIKKADCRFFRFRLGRMCYRSSLVHWLHIYVERGGRVMEVTKVKDSRVILEAEYVSLAEAVKEAIYLRSLLKELGSDKFANVMLFVDNQAALCLATDSVCHSCAKHIDIKYHFVRNALIDERIVVKYVSTNNMVADVLTKALPGQKHVKCVCELGLKDC